MEVNIDYTLSTSAHLEHYLVSSTHRSSEKHIGRANSTAEIKARDEDPYASGEASVKGSGSLALNYSDLGAVDDGNLACTASYTGFGSGQQSSLRGIKAHQLYTLRRNPKPSKRFEDQKFPMEMAPSPAPRKSTKEESHQCIECKKEFVSSRALAGHMRCHPEREWRGIYCPKRKNKSLESKVNRPQSSSSSQWQDSPSHMAHFDADNQSDAESIEAAYMNAKFKHNCRSWRTGKRSKHSHQKGRSPQAALSQKFELGSHSTAGKGVKEDRDMADCLVMLAYAGKIQEHESQGGMGWNRSIRSLKVGGQGNNAEFDKVSEEQKEDMQLDPGEIDGKLQFECKICKRVFKSCQALGGHRASHKKVKGCFARAHDSDRASYSPEEDLTEEDLPNCQQPNFQDHVHRIPMDAQREIPRAKHPNNPKFSHAQRIKPHECSICHKTFQSGQALGGHKRCHWGGTASLETSFSQKQQLARTEKSKISREQVLDHHFPAPKDSADDTSLDLKGASTPNHMHLLKSRFNHHSKNKNLLLRLNSLGNGAHHTVSSASSKHKLPRIASSCDEKLQGAQEEVSSTQNSILDDHADPLALTPWYVEHNLCDQVSSSIANLNNQQRNHTNTMDSVAGLTPISA